MILSENINNNTSISIFSLEKFKSFLDRKQKYFEVLDLEEHITDCKIIIEKFNDFIIHLQEVHNIDQSIISNYTKLYDLYNEEFTTDICYYCERPIQFIKTKKETNLNYCQFTKCNRCNAFIKWITDDFDNIYPINYSKTRSCEIITDRHSCTINKPKKKPEKNKSQKLFPTKKKKEGYK